MPPIESLQRQLERILDQTKTDEVDVIVQMQSSTDRLGKLPQAAGSALTRRRLTLTPRELLPSHYEKSRGKPTSASTHDRLGKAKQEALALKQIQKLGESPMKPLLKSGLVKAAIERMIAPLTKSGPELPAPPSFWTSRAMPLRLTKDELTRLPGEVPSIRSLHLNRTLKVPSLVEIRQHALETDEILSTTWGLRKIQALATWGVHRARGEKIKIGLLDTGVDAAHPDLLDAQGKSKVVHWAEFDSLGQPVNASTPHDSDEHGTHCAGTLVGGNASGRWIGVAPEARLAAALVLNGEQGGTDAQVLAGIDWCVEQKVDVISLSLGGLVMDAETPPTYTEAIVTCIEAGIPVIAAIGNEGGQTTGSPGNDLFAISIGATDPLDRAAGFSGGRTQILRESDFIDSKFLPLPYSKPELSAPGVAIYSSVPGGKYKALSGTSMATPHVAGAIALLLSATSIRDKEQGQQRAFLLQDLIIGSVEDLGESGQDHRYGFGRLDVLRAIDFAVARGYAL